MLSHGSAWTEAELQFLRERHAAGDTFSKIAAGLPGRSRNSVIGKALRMNLEKRQIANGRHKTNMVRKARRKKTWTAKRTLADLLPPAEDRVVPEPDGAFAISFDELKRDSCRFPLGPALAPPPFTFCGHKRLDGFSYCEFHCRISYTPLPRRTRNGTQAENRP